MRASERRNGDVQLSRRVKQVRATRTAIVSTKSVKTRRRKSRSTPPQHIDDKATTNNNDNEDRARSVTNARKRTPTQEYARGVHRDRVGTRKTKKRLTAPLQGRQF